MSKFANYNSYYHNDGFFDIIKFNDLFIDRDRTFDNVVKLILDPATQINMHLKDVFNIFSNNRFNKFIEFVKSIKSEFKMNNKIYILNAYRIDNIIEIKFKTRDLSNMSNADIERISYSIINNYSNIREEIIIKTFKSKDYHCSDTECNNKISRNENYNSNYYSDIN